ncbi:cohesin domain-containing protein [Saprospiraceae bacterium]|nr:cohesin domain-containing protein [Saprospiraceae bacterium]
MKNEILTNTKHKMYNHMSKFRTLSLSVQSWLFCLMTMCVATTISAQCENINLACNGGVNVSINEDCFAAINVDLILENPPFEEFPDTDANYSIVIRDAEADTIVDTPTADRIVGQEYVGRTLEVSVELVPCGISCWGFLTIEDKIGPRFSDCTNGFLPDVILSCDEFEGAVIPEPEIGGFCTDKFLTFADDTSGLTCVGQFAVQILRTYTATDDAGNSSQCQLNILVEKANLADIVFPDNFTETLTSASSCDEADDLSPAVTGFPTGITCPNIMFFFTDIEYPQCGIQRKLLRDWFVIDWCTGDSRDFGQIIKVIDNIAPISVCPPDTIRLPINPHTCTASPVLNPMAIAGFDMLGALDQSTLIDCSLPITIEVGFLPAIPNTAQPIDGPYMIIPRNMQGLYELPEIEQAGWIRYCFTDACGNSTKTDPTPDNPFDADNTCCFFEVATTDTNPPIAICEGFTKVPLLEGGMTEIPASAFDDTSFDPCGEIASFQVKREQSFCPGFPLEATEFGESVHFCCADLGDTITIRLRVFDNDGNFSECLGLVCVQDQGSTSVTCMDATINLDCDEDFTDRSITGIPMGASNECDNGIVIGDDMFSFTGFDEACGIGVIVRTVRVTDLNGALLRTCRQNINFDEDDNPTALMQGDYTFPDDIMLDQCSASFSLDPQFTGLPTTTKEFGCTSIAISFEDSGPFVSNVDGVCFKIQRTWTVVDWCRFDPNNPDLFSDTGVQEIIVKNNISPSIVCPTGTIAIEAEPGECEAQVDITAQASTTCVSPLGASYTVDEFNDGSINDRGTGLTLSGVFPVGTHKVTFIVTNECGAIPATCTIMFMVSGDKPPTPICLASVVKPIGQDGTINVMASSFNFKSEGGCDRNDDLIFSYLAPDEPGFPQLSETFTCDDIANGIATALPIIVYVIDESGAFSSCFTEIVLQDNIDVCQDAAGSRAVVAGSVFTEDSEPVENVMVEMRNMTMQENVMDMTSAVGGFAFEELSFYLDYAVQPVNDVDYLNGVSTLDLVHIQRHILGSTPLDSPYKLIAADVDNSSSVTAIDLIQLRKLILGIYDELPQNDSWTFVPTSHEFTDVMAPWDSPNRIDLHSLFISEMEADFVAVKIGDVNSSAIVNLDATDIEKRSNDNVMLSTDNMTYKAGELVAVPLRVDRDVEISGLQFTIEFDSNNLLFEGIDNGTVEVGQNNFALLNNYDGVLTFSFDDQTGITLTNDDILFTIYFEAKQSSSIIADVDLTSKVTRAEAYNQSDEILGLNFVTRVLSANGDYKGLEVFQNEPNPFSDETTIAFFIPATQQVQLTVLDASGKVLVEQSGLFNEGINDFRISSDQLNSGGILIYRIESESSSVTKKMILVK